MHACLLICSFFVVKLHTINTRNSFQSKKGIIFQNEEGVKLFSIIILLIISYHYIEVFSEPGVL